MYKDIDGIKQRYADWGIRLVEDINEERAIVKDEWTSQYLIWSKCWNRAFSRYGNNNVLIPITFRSIEEARQYS